MPRVPRPGAGRHALEAWGQQHPVLPLVGDKAGRTKADACRRWPGPSGLRPAEGADSEGRVTQEEVRLLVGHARQLAQPPPQASASAQEKAAAALTDQVQRVHAPWFACAAAGAAALAAYAHHGPGQRGRRPRPWR